MIDWLIYWIVDWLIDCCYYYSAFSNNGLTCSKTFPVLTKIQYIQKFTNFSSTTCPAALTRVLITNYTGQNISQNIFLKSTTSLLLCYQICLLYQPILFFIQFPTSDLSLFTQSSIHHSYLTSLSVTSTTFHLLHIGTARLYNPTQCVSMSSSIQISDPSYWSIPLQCSNTLFIASTILIFQSSHISNACSKTPSQCLLMYPYFQSRLPQLSYTVIYQSFMNTPHFSHRLSPTLWLKWGVFMNDW